MQEALLLGGAAVKELSIALICQTTGNEGCAILALDEFTVDDGSQLLLEEDITSRTWRNQGQT